MNKHKPTIILVTAALLMFFAASTYGLEAYDHPTIGRYEGSSIIHQESRATLTSTGWVFRPLTMERWLKRLPQRERF